MSENTIRYTLTGAAFDGELLLEYTPDGVLKSLTNNATFDPNQLKGLARNFPITITDLIDLVRKSSELKATLQKADLSFENVWNKYNHKVDKREAEREWNKLTDGEKLKVLESIPAYDYYLMVKKIEKLYFMRYLSKRRFEVDYKALTKA